MAIMLEDMMKSFTPQQRTRITARVKELITQEVARREKDRKPVVNRKKVRGNCGKTERID